MARPDGLNWIHGVFSEILRNRPHHLPLNTLIVFLLGILFIFLPLWCIINLTSKPSGNKHSFLCSWDCGLAMAVPGSVVIFWLWFQAKAPHASSYFLNWGPVMAYSSCARSPEGRTIPTAWLLHYNIPFTKASFFTKHKSMEQEVYSAHSERRRKANVWLTEIQTIKNMYFMRHWFLINQFLGSVCKLRWALPGVNTAQRESCKILDGYTEVNSNDCSISWALSPWE